MKKTFFLLLLTFFASMQFSGLLALNDNEKAKLYSLVEKHCDSSQVEGVYKASYSALRRLKSRSLEAAEAVLPPVCQLNFSRWKVRTTMLLGHGALETGASVKAVNALIPIVLKNKVISRNHFAKYAKQWQLFYVSGVPTNEISAIFKQALASKYKTDAIEALGFAYLFYRTLGDAPEAALISAHKLVGKVKRKSIDEEEISDIISSLCQGKESKFCQDENIEEFPWRKSKGFLKPENS